MTFSSVTDMISIVPSGKIFPPPCFKLIKDKKISSKTESGLKWLIQRGESGCP